MLKLSVLCFLLICLKFTAFCNNSVCSKCECTEYTLNCSGRKFQSVPNLSEMDKTSIYLDHNEILHVHQFPKLSVYHLSLSYNDISKIDESAFKYLFNLTSLDLSNNFLTTSSIFPSTFRGTYQVEMYEPLRHLKELNLENNYLHSIHPDLFEHIPNLEKLILGGNPLKIISHGMITALSSVPFLKELNLSSTSLSLIPENVFHAPKYLHTLDLSNNLFEEPSKELGSSHSIKWLSLSGNPIKRIDKGLMLPFLRTLHLSNMSNLISITNKSLSMLPLLEEFYCSNNKKLMKISEDVFTSIQINQDEQEEKIWPPLKVLVLNSNSLRYLPRNLLNKWDNLKVIKLENNPWMCDCSNQWLISTLMQAFDNKSRSHDLASLRCSQPIEMRGKLFLDLYHRHYEMRCLDFYGDKPENDGKLLIQVLIISLIATPLMMSVLIYYKRKKYFNKVSKNPFTSEYYNYAQLKVFPNEKCYGPRDKNITFFTFSKIRDCEKKQESWIRTVKLFYICTFLLLLVVLPSLYIGYLYYKSVLKYQENYKVYTELQAYNKRRIYVECSEGYF